MELNSSINEEGYRLQEDFKANPYAIVLSKIIDMGERDTVLNRELIGKVAALIARFEADLTSDCGITFDEKPKEWRYQRNKSTVCRANSLSLIRKKKFDYIKSSFNSFK